MTESAREQLTRRRRMFGDSAVEMLNSVSDLCVQWERDITAPALLHDIRYHINKAKIAARLVEDAS